MVNYEGNVEMEAGIEGVFRLYLLPGAALFSQVVLLAVVLTLVPIIIMSIIILIAVWKKVIQMLPPKGETGHWCFWVSRARLLYVVRSRAMRSDGRWSSQWARTATSTSTWTPSTCPMTWPGKCHETTWFWVRHEGTDDPAVVQMCYTMVLLKLNRGEALSLLSGSISFKTMKHTKLYKHPWISDFTVNCI